MKKYIKIILFALLVLIVDQVSKIFIVNLLPLNKSLNIIPNFFSLTLTRNYGAAWSMLWDKKIILILISFIALFLIGYLIIKEKKLTILKNIYYSFLIGGITGNLLDRILNGYVIDFLDFNLFGYNFPIFNISDTFIVIGVILMIFETFLGGEKNV